MDEAGFGEWLSRRRKSVGLTQKQLADRVNCAQITLRKIEADQRRPSVQIVERLAEILNIPVSEQNAFLHFARGDRHRFHSPEMENLPWHGSDASFDFHLPTPLTPLIGREQELASVKGFILAADTRLVTLIGPPGIGKTRLSLAVARETLSNFPDGVYFIALEPLEVPHLLATSILRSLGLEEITGKSPIERLKDGIGNKHLLMVLDNLEHLVEDAGPLVYDLLIACPNLKILTTSREALRLAGEQIFSLPALTIPSEKQLLSMDAETALKYTGLQLFIERAKAVQPDFSLNQGNLQDIAAICNQLDGLPLAIELLAARINLMTPQILLTRLNSHLVLHTTGERSLPSHHKSLYHAINWSYGLLSPEEQRLFTYLSVFSGGFTLEAVEQAFCEVSNHKEVIHREVTDLIASLLEKSLLQSKVDLNGEQRFYMLTTIQQFAAERLHEIGEEEIARERHLNYFLKFSESAYREIHGQDQGKWIHRIENDQDNLRAALNWCFSVQKTTQALFLLTVLGWQWLLRGNYSEMFCWFEQIRSQPDINDHPLIYAELLVLIGRSKWILGDYDHARSVLEESLALGLTLGKQGEKIAADSLRYLGQVSSISESDFANGEISINAES